MKILHVTNAYPYENWPIYGIFVKEQIDSINQMVEKNDVFFINGKKYGKFEYLNAIFKLKKLISAYDIIHAHHIYVGFILLLFFKKHTIIVSLMSDPDRKTGGFFINFIYGLSYKYCLKHAKALIYKKEIPVDLSKKALYYLPNGVNTQVFHPMPQSDAKQRLGLDENKKYILFVSSNNLNRREKRHDRFLEVLQILRDKYHLYDLEPLYMINVKREETPFYFNAASLHLLVSDVEGSPNSVKEALACNTPVVSTNVGNVREMLQGLNGCFVVDTFDARDIADAVKNSLESSVDHLSDQILSLNLDQSSVAHKLVDIYKHTFEETI